MSFHSFIPMAEVMTYLWWNKVLNMRFSRSFIILLVIISLCELFL